MIASDRVQAVPIRFQGNPVNSHPRSHSAMTQARARPSTRRSPGSHSLAARATRAGNSASAAEMARTAGAASQAKRSGSVSKAMPIQ